MAVPEILLEIPEMGISGNFREIPWLERKFNGNFWKWKFREFPTKIPAHPYEQDGRVVNFDLGDYERHGIKFTPSSGSIQPGQSVQIFGVQMNEDDWEGEVSRQTEVEV